MMDKKFEFITEEHNGKYYILFEPNTSSEELTSFVKDLEHLLRPYHASAHSIGDKIELFLSTEKLEEELHLINKFIKEKNKK